MEKVLAPEGTDHIKVGIRIDAVPETEAFYCSPLEVGELTKDPYSGFSRVDFEGGRVDRRKDVKVKLGPGTALKTTTVNTGARRCGSDNRGFRMFSLTLLFGLTRAGVFAYDLGDAAG